MEILAGHDVQGRLRPAFGDTDAFLLEDGSAFVVLNDCVAHYPVDRCIRVACGEVAIQHQAWLPDFLESVRRIAASRRREDASGGLGNSSTHACDPFR